MSAADKIVRDGKSAGATRSRSRALSLGATVLVLGLVACVHLVFWALKNPATTAAPVEDRLASLSYNRFEGAASAGLTVPEARIRADLTAIAGQAKAVRTYASTQGLERVPKIAAELGLTVTLGAWIDNDNARNEREIASALDLARHNPNVTRLVVGNETVFRHEHSAAELGSDCSARETGKSGSGSVRGKLANLHRTSGTWQRRRPDLCPHHSLLGGCAQRRPRSIGRWRFTSSCRQPSRAKGSSSENSAGRAPGRNFEQSMPGPITQAVVLRDFVARATALGIDYNIVEAIDQPEKLFEGNVGPYWGVLDASLRPKFAWTGPLVDAEYWKAAACAVLVGLLLSLSILLLPGATIGQVALLAGADHVIGDWCASVLGYWHAHYFLHGEVIAFGIGLPLLGLLAPILLSRIGELASVTFGRNPARLLRDIAATPGRCRAKGLDPYSRVPGAAGDAVAYHRFGGAARIPEF